PHTSISSIANKTADMVSGPMGLESLLLLPRFRQQQAHLARFLLGHRHAVEPHRPSSRFSLPSNAHLRPGGFLRTFAVRVLPARQHFHPTLRHSRSPSLALLREP